MQRDCVCESYSFLGAKWVLSKLYQAISGYIRLYPALSSYIRLYPRRSLLSSLLGVHIAKDTLVALCQSSFDVLCVDGLEEVRLFDPEHVWFWHLVLLLVIGVVTLKECGPRTRNSWQ